MKRMRKPKNQDSVESTQKEEERPRSLTPPPARKFPESICAICLDSITNKSFTDSCFHMFCFTCLVDWSKVKPECPFCKKSFSRIVHNVKSIQDFDQYLVKEKIDDSRSCMRRFDYRTTLTHESSINSSRDIREISISSNNFTPLRMDYSSSSQESKSNETCKKKKKSDSKKKHPKECRKQEKIVLKRNSDKNSWEYNNSTLSFKISSFINNSDSYELAGPSSAQAIPFISDLHDDPTIEIDITNVDDYEECQVLNVIKPKAERPPEIVDLSSDDDVPNIVREDDTDELSSEY